MYILSVSKTSYLSILLVAEHAKYYQTMALKWTGVLTITSATTGCRQVSCLLFQTLDFLASQNEKKTKQHTNQS